MAIGGKDGMFSVVMYGTVDQISDDLLKIRFLSLGLVVAVDRALPGGVLLARGHREHHLLLQAAARPTTLRQGGVPGEDGYDEECDDDCFFLFLRDRSAADQRDTGLLRYQVWVPLL
jgi:hypothetical protein